MFAIVYGSASTARFVEQAIIDTDPTDDCAPVPLSCNAPVEISWFTYFPHWYCDPITCIGAAFEAFEAAREYRYDYED